MTLLKEIIDEATTKNGDLTRLLRLSMVLATRLKHEPLLKWCRQELEGYAPDADLPGYRVFETRSRGNFIGPLGSWQAVLEIPLRVLPEDVRDKYRKAYFRGGVAEYTDLAAGSEEPGYVQLAWPRDAAMLHGVKAAAKGSQCVNAWREVSTPGINGFLDQIKTKVLAFALEIEGQYPDAGEATSPTQQIEAAKVAHIFHTTINGNVQNYAAGSAGVTQSAVMNVTAGDWASLEVALKAAGLQPATIEELREAVDADGPTDKSMGSRVKSWLADLTVKAHSGLAGVSTEVAGGLVTQALLLYLGMAT